MFKYFNTKEINVYACRRSVKYEEVYLKDYQSVHEAKQGISDYMNFYSHERPHQSLNYRMPAEVYFDKNKQSEQTQIVT